MKSSETRRLEMFIRVRQFGASHAQSFPPNTRGGEVLAEVDSAINELESHASAQDSGKRAAKEGTTLTAVARAELREDLEAIRRTARSMSQAMPGLTDKFRVPGHTRDQELLAIARAFAADAEPVKAELIRRGLPANFVDDLNADIASFAGSIDVKARHTGARIAATAAVDTAIERGTNAVRELDAIVRNVFRNDAATLAEWTSASHTERAPRTATHTPDPATNPSNPPHAA
ncbi:MAG: hypothetical protein QOF61_201 [Acidobacteriota bacterium]|jgi:hypothetical protein|nr:hypothetical protein [Acidobacteriota bacterium]